MFFFFNDTATTEIYTLSLHDALPILHRARHDLLGAAQGDAAAGRDGRGGRGHQDQAAQEHHREGSLSRRAADSDRKSIRLNSSHSQISYAVFCLKKKK